VKEPASDPIIPKKKSMAIRDRMMFAMINPSADASMIFRKSFITGNISDL
jgi:hypothetical protein